MFEEEHRVERRPGALPGGVHERTEDEAGFLPRCQLGHDVVVDVILVAAGGTMISYSAIRNVATRESRGTTSRRESRSTRVAVKPAGSFASGDFCQRPNAISSANSTTATAPSAVLGGTVSAERAPGTIASTCPAAMLPLCRHAASLRDNSPEPADDGAQTMRCAGAAPAATWLTRQNTMTARAWEKRGARIMWWRPGSAEANKLARKTLLDFGGASAGNSLPRPLAGIYARSNAPPGTALVVRGIIVNMPGSTCMSQRSDSRSATSPPPSPAAPPLGLVADGAIGFAAARPRALEENLARPLVTGRHGMVTSLHPLSSMAGVGVLMKGGNAFDAAIAAALAATVVDPKNSTIGGQGFATVYVAKEKRVRALNFYGPAPRAATVDALAGKNYDTGYLSTPVPSNLRGYAALHAAHGSLAWRDVVAPALDLAENGFVLTADFTGPLELLAARLDYPGSRRVYFPEGRVPRPGTVFKQPDLARTLRRIADEGADVFYRGDLARGIAKFYSDHGGLLAYDDLVAYEAKWVEPISTTYRGYTVFTQPPNSSGIAVLLQLNLLEGFELGKFTHNSAEYLHLIGEVQRLAIADRNRHVADPEFSAVPVAQLLSKDYAAARRRLLARDRTLPFVPPPENSPLPPPVKGNTTHLSVVDASGNMVSLTQTLGAWFGSGVVAADTGVLFSNQLRHLHTDPASPSRLGPGRRPRSNQSPLIVLDRNGAPFLAIGTPGNDGIWQRMVQVLVNIFDFNMDVQHAVAAPRLVYGGFQETGTEIPPLFAAEDRLPESTLAGLRARGYTLELIHSDEGSVNGIMRDSASGFLLGGADPRRWGAEGTWAGDAASVYAIGW
ncbi:MAG: gamma-glutamyltransferase [Opitutus sp.]|nr:gamma-glutamyltransferase [Opitutus sp.]